MRAVTVGVAEREAPEGALRLSVGGGFAGMKTMVWLRRGGDEALGWTLVKEYGDAYEGADGGSSYLDLDPADFAAGSLPAAGEACSVRVETLTDAEYMACTRTATGVHEVSCTVQPADRPAIADARVSSASGRAGSEQPLGETLVRPAGGVLTFRVGSTGFQSEDVDYKLRLVPDAESGQGAAGDGILDADFAAVGSGDRTGTLEWDTSATPSGTYMLSLEAASHSFASSRSASQRCVVTLTRTGETVPELDATTPIRVSRTDRHATATIAGTGLDAVYATLWVSTPFRSIATARGTGAAAASLDLSLPGYGVYRLDATVRRPGLKTYDDAATQYFHWDRADPVRFVGVEARTGGAEGAPWTADLIVSPGTAVRFTATAVGGGGTAGSPQDLAAGYEYSFWTEDAGDWHQLRGWSTDPAWTYTPTDSGSYSVVAFARGADGLAGSYEAAWSTTLVVSGAPDLGGYRLVKGLGLSAKGIGATGAEEGGDGALAGLVARTPVRLSVEVDPTAKDAQGNLLASAALPERRLYRFEVIDDHLYTTLRGFSSDPTCLWIPRKPGTYRILVHIRDAKSGGFEDVHTVAEDVSVG